MAGSGEKLALSMVIVSRKSEAPSLVCSRDMATPTSLNYREQSYPEGSYDRKYGLFAAAQQRQGRTQSETGMEWGFVPRVRLQSHTEAG